MRLFSLDLADKEGSFAAGTKTRARCIAFKGNKSLGLRVEVVSLARAAERRLRLQSEGLLPAGETFQHSTQSARSQREANNSSSEKETLQPLSANYKVMILVLGSETPSKRESGKSPWTGWMDEECIQCKCLWHCEAHPHEKTEAQARERCGFNASEPSTRVRVHLVLW